MPPRRKRYLDNTVPADNTANVVRPVNRMIQVKQKDTPKRREDETAKARAKAEQARVTPVNPRQASIGPYRQKTAIDKAGGRLYAEAEQRAKNAQDREAAGVVLNSLFKPVLPSTYIDMVAAIKNGQVNNLSDALAAPYLSDSWSMRNPGKALVADILTPVAAGDIARSYRAMRMGLKNPRLGIVADPRHPSGFRFSPEEKKFLELDALYLPKVIGKEPSLKLREMAYEDLHNFMRETPSFTEPDTYVSYLNNVHGLNTFTGYGGDIKYSKHYNRTYQKLKDRNQYPSSPRDSKWDNLFEEAINNKDANKLYELRLAHHRVAVEENYPQAVRFPFVHTVSDRYNPEFNKFNPLIEGHPSFIYGTPINEKNIAMSQSYVSDNLLRNEPHRTKRLLGYLENPLEFDAQGNLWSGMPVPVKPDEIVDSKTINELITRVNTKIDDIENYVNVVPTENSITLPRLQYGDNLSRYVTKIRDRLYNADFDPYEVYKYHKKLYEDERRTLGKPQRVYYDPYKFHVFLKNRAYFGEGRSNMLSPNVLREEFEAIHNDPFNPIDPYWLDYKSNSAGGGDYIMSGAKSMSTRELERMLRRKGQHDGFIIDNVRDYGGMSFDPQLGFEPGTVYGIENPAHIKTANPITYDDAGNMIPLSKRDNFNINDLRYGLLPFTIGGLGLSLYNKK